MVKKRSPTKIIESTPASEIEHVFYKSLGKEIEDVTNYSGNETQSNQSPIKGVKRYTHIHTHPTALPKIKRSFLDTWFPGLFHPESKYDERKEINYSATPSGKDMESFLEDKNQKTMVIAVRESDTGKVRGYTVLKKTKATPKGVSGADIKAYRQAVRGEERLRESAPALHDFAEKYNLNYRFVSAEDYTLNKERTQFIKKSLEQKALAVIAAAGILGSLFFISSTLTGNAIANIKNSTSSFLGAGLLIVGLIAWFFWIRNKKAD